MLSAGMWDPLAHCDTVVAPYHYFKLSHKMSEILDYEYSVIIFYLLFLQPEIKRSLNCSCLINHPMFWMYLLKLHVFRYPVP